MAIAVAYIYDGSRGSRCGGRARREDRGQGIVAAAALAVRAHRLAHRGLSLLLKIAPWPAPAMLRSSAAKLAFIICDNHSP